MFDITRPVDVPMLTQFKLVGTYPLPLGIRFSGTFQSQPGTERIVTYEVTRTLVPTLVQPRVLVRLTEPGSSYNDRVNQMDLSISKTIRTGKATIQPEASLFNALNANPVLAQVNTFGPALGNAQTILAPRLLRLGLTMRF